MRKGIQTGDATHAKQRCWANAVHIPGVLRSTWWAKFIVPLTKKDLAVGVSEYGSHTRACKPFMSTYQLSRGKINSIVDADRPVGPLRGHFRTLLYWEGSMQVGRVSRLEGMTYNAWIGGVSEACSFNLAQQLLTRNDETRLLAVNFDPQVLYHVISRLMCCGMVTGVFHLKLPHKLSAGQPVYASALSLWLSTVTCCPFCRSPTAFMPSSQLNFVNAPSAIQRLLPKILFPVQVRNSLSIHFFNNRHSESANLRLGRPLRPLTSTGL